MSSVNARAVTKRKLEEAIAVCSTIEDPELRQTGWDTIVSTAIAVNFAVVGDKVVDLEVTEEAND
jgi:hypothetical protein